MAPGSQGECSCSMPGTADPMISLLCDKCCCLGQGASEGEGRLCKEGMQGRGEPGRGGLLGLFQL